MKFNYLFMNLGGFSQSLQMDLFIFFCSNVCCLIEYKGPTFDYVVRTLQKLLSHHVKLY